MANPLLHSRLTCNLILPIHEMCDVVLLKQA